MTATEPPAPRGGSDRLRRQNLAAVLEHVHHAGGASRAELTRATGLNRSTVGALVAELVERGLVVEADPERAASVGRPSPRALPSPAALAAAVHPELDAVEVGLVALGGAVVARRRRALDAAPTVAEAVAIAAELLDELRAERPEVRVLGLGVAVPGLVRAADGLVRLAPHLGWVDEPLGALLAEATGLPVSAANDASLGAQAERVFGAARGLDHLVYLNGGASGIGGGIIANGAPLGGADGYAGEFGHIAVRGADGPSLEDAVSRAELLALLGVEPDGLAAALAAADDPAVTEAVHRQLDALSISLRNIVNVLNPQAVLLGGFLAALDAAAPGHLSRRVGERALPAPFASVVIAPAALGDELLMIGAAELAFERVLADPASA